MIDAANRIHTSADVHQYYVSQGGKLPAGKFKAIARDFFQLVVCEILFKGLAWKVSSWLGSLEIHRFNRTFKRLRVNFGETRKYQAANPGTDVIIYYTDPHVYRLQWHKFECNTPNKRVYRFDFTVGPLGNNRALVKYIANNEMAALEFKQHEVHLTRPRKKDRQFQ